jgi:ribosomal-protein-alanine N-acetyltransferase
MHSKFGYRKFVADDYAAFVSQVTNEACMRYVSYRPLTPPEYEKKFAHILQLNNKNPHLGYFIVFEPFSQKVMGQVKLVWNVDQMDQLELGYMLYPEYWGKGLGFALAQEMQLLAQKYYANFLLMAVIHPENVGSARILQKLGMKPYFTGEIDGLPTQKWKMV